MRHQEVELLQRRPPLALPALLRQAKPLGLLPVSWTAG